jgi:hypothetical protein
MTGLVAAIRPDDWNFPLLLHVTGAMILVGATLTAASALAFARGDERLLRLGYWTLLVVGLPSYVLMWIYSKEGLDDSPIDFAWVTIGFVVAEGGALLFVVSLILGGIGVRRLRDGKGEGFLKATMWISVLLLAAFVVAVWAMAGKPD